MRIRWRLILPVVALLLFSLGTYESFAHPIFPQSRYFWWASLRLDSDPLGKRNSSTSTGDCKPAGEACLFVDTEYILVHPGWLARLLIICAAPAFILGRLVVHGFARLGISEVRTFMVSMPLLIATWFYFVGWLLDRRRLKRTT